MKIISSGSVGQDTGYWVDGEDRSVKAGENKVYPRKVEVSHSAVRMEGTPYKRNYDGKATSKSVDQFSISKASQVDESSKIVDVKYIRRMAKQKLATDRFIEDFSHGNEYDKYKHKYKWTNIKENSCLLGAIATTLFGKMDPSSEVEKFVNDLRDYIDFYDIQKSGHMLDATDENLILAIHGFILEKYGVNTELVCLQQSCPQDGHEAGTSFRQITRAHVEGYSHDSYKVPVIFEAKGGYCTFYGVSLEDYIREKPPIPKKPEGWEEMYQKAMERRLELDSSNKGNRPTSVDRKEG